jgi:vacuolar-type H+-ATPase catalytic subunit A/Vma1
LLIDYKILRSGVIKTADQSEGSLTMIGTVSPAGGNFEEPVTQSTLGTVKTFLGLSADNSLCPARGGIGNNQDVQTHLTAMPVS